MAYKKVTIKTNQINTFEIGERFSPVNTPCMDRKLTPDPDVFFPDPTDLQTIRKAKELCAMCNPETKTECLSFGMKTKSYGIWGGTTFEERNSIRRKIQRSKSK